MDEEKPLREGTIFEHKSKDAPKKPEISEILMESSADVVNNRPTDTVVNPKISRPSQSKSMVGKTWGNYKLVSELGQGGMGVVFRAEHLGLKKEVAIKTMIAGENASFDLISRFVREAQTMAGLEHDNIVQVYDADEAEGIFYIAMEFVRGRSLEDLINEDEFSSPLQAAEIMEPVARAIHFAHSKRIIHRDIKPANILISDNSRPKVTDFGLAKTNKSQLTQSGVALGTPAYMPPEQVRGDSDLDGRADVYSLGATLYEVLVGAPPFDGPNAHAIFHSILTQEPRSPRQRYPDIPGDIDTIVMKCLEKDPVRRYQTALELADDLKFFREGRAISAKPPSIIYQARKHVSNNVLKYVAAGVGVLALVGGGLAFSANQSARKAEEEKVSVEKEKEQERKAREKAEKRIRTAEDLERKLAAAEFDYTPAKRVFERAVSARYRGGEIDVWEKKTQEALSGLEKALKKFPNYAEALVLKGTILRERAATDFKTDEDILQEAISTLNRVCNLHETREERLIPIRKETFAEAFYQRGRAHASYLRLMGDSEDKESIKEQATSDLQKAIELGAAEEQASFGRGVLASYSGEYFDAITHFNEAIAIDPWDLNTFYYRGLAHYNAASLDVGHYGDCVRDMSKVIKHQPRNIDAYLQRTVAYMEQRAFGLAMKDTLHILEDLDQKNSGAWYNRALIYIRQGERSEAIKALIEGAEKGRDGPEKKLIERALEEEMGEKR